MHGQKPSTVHYTFACTMKFWGQIWAQPEPLQLHLNSKGCFNWGLTPQPSRCEAIVLTTTQPCQFVQNVKLGVEQSLKCTSSKTPWTVTGLLGLLPPTRSCFIFCSQLCINRCIFFTLLQNYARSFFTNISPDICVHANTGRNKVKSVL